MDKPINVSLNNPKQPSKLLALIALAIAISLPFVLVKTFPHKQKSFVSSIQLTLTPAEDQDLYPPSQSIEDEETTEEQTPVEESKVTPKEPVPEATSKTAPAKPHEPVKVVKQEPVWKIIKTRPKDTLAKVFSRAGLGPNTVKEVLKDNPHSHALTALKADQEIQLLIGNKILEKMILPFSTTQYLVVEHQKGHYRIKINTRKMNTHNHFLTATVKGSLYATAKRQKIPPKLIRQMTEIFTWNINFAKEVKEGDHFTIVYQAFYVENKLVGTGDIVAVSYQNRGKTYQAVRHTLRGGKAEYFTPDGRSLKKAFNRYPIRFSHISSTFSLSRYHPILHYRRAHKGIDLAARIGTPIQATGDGRIVIIGRQSGYGNMIKISHGQKYSSIYGHMLKFQKGLSRGSYVKRGQVIGYVGQSGLASGPHCHYEFHINGSPRNPATIDIPIGEAITGRELARFKANTGSVLAQLKKYEKSQIVQHSKKPKTKRG